MNGLKFDSLKNFVDEILNRGQQLVDNACDLEEEIMKITNSKI